MKVKDLIKELEKLDQEKGIWTGYNFYHLLPPIIEKIFDPMGAALSCKISIHSFDKKGEKRKLGTLKS